MCPGPALADLAAMEPKAWLFVAAMLAGMILANVWRNRPSAAKALPQA
jgi:hypothetical protein